MLWCELVPSFSSISTHANSGLGTCILSSGHFKQIVRVYILKSYLSTEVDQQYVMELLQHSRVKSIMITEEMFDTEPSLTKMLLLTAKAIRFQPHWNKDETFCSSVNPVIVLLAHSGTV